MVAVGIAFAADGACASSAREPGLPVIAERARRSIADRRAATAVVSIDRTSSSSDTPRDSARRFSAAATWSSNCRTFSCAMEAV
jgi:hypothetical protein